MTREPHKLLYEFIVAIGDSLSDLVCLDDEQDGEDEDNEDTEVGQLSDDDEPGWVMSTTSKTVPQRIEPFQEKHMTLDEVTQLGKGDAVEYVCQWEEKYGTTELSPPALVEPQTDDVAGASALKTFGELVECLDNVAGISLMLQGTIWPGSIHMRLGSGMPQSNEGIQCLPPDAEPDSSSV